MRDINYTDWEAYGHALRVSSKQIKRWCGVSERTARRWIASGKFPEPARRLITLSALGGVLPLSWRERGFRFWGDRLHTANRHYFDPGNLEYQELQYTRLLTAEITIDKLRAEILMLQEFVEYLKSVAPMAEVIKFDPDKTRRSLTDGKQQNRLFQKPAD